MVLSKSLLSGLRNYFKSSKPKVYLFNGREKGKPLGTSAVQQTFRLAAKKAKIIKEVSVYSLRHTFATDLLEEGVDIITIKEQLGHASIESTLVYLHVAKVTRILSHSPFDTLYMKRKQE